MLEGSGTDWICDGERRVTTYISLNWLGAKPMASEISLLPGGFPCVPFGFGVEDDDLFPCIMVFEAGWPRLGRYVSRYWFDSILPYRPFVPSR